MRRVLRFSVIAAIAMIATAGGAYLQLPEGKAATAREETPVGRWQCVAKAAQASESLKFYLAPISEGGKLAGKVRTPYGNFTITGGSFDKGKLSLTVRTVEGVTGNLSGTVKETKLIGEWSLDNDMSGTFECYSVTKAPAKPEGEQ
jgi:hypothetical protein